MCIYLVSQIITRHILVFNSKLIDISTKLKNLSFTHIVLGGDMNCSPSRNKKAWSNLLSHISKFGSNHVEHKPNTYIFRQEKLNNYTCIDQFFTDWGANSILILM